MIPHKLRLSNFMCYRDEQTLDFSGIHLACLAGDNGHGKSALLDAITWALSGRAQATRRDDELIALGEVEMWVEDSSSAWDRSAITRLAAAEQKGRGQSDLHFYIWNPTPWNRPSGGGTVRPAEASIPIPRGAEPRLLRHPPGLPDRRQRPRQVHAARRHHLGAVGQGAGAARRRADHPRRDRDVGRVRVRPGPAALSRLAAAQQEGPRAERSALLRLESARRWVDGEAELAVLGRRRPARAAGADHPHPAAGLRDLHQLRLPAPGPGRLLHRQDRQRAQADPGRHPGPEPLRPLRGARQGRGPDAQGAGGADRGRDRGHRRRAGPPRRLRGAAAGGPRRGCAGRRGACGRPKPSRPRRGSRCRSAGRRRASSPICATAWPAPSATWPMAAGQLDTAKARLAQFEAVLASAAEIEAGWAALQAPRAR